MIRFLALLAVLGLGASSAAADRAPQATHVAVPPSHWTYTALRQVLAEVDVPGLSPIRFMGDVVFNRSELAEAAWSACEAVRDVGDPGVHTVRWVGALLREFAWELEARGRSPEDALAWLSETGDTSYSTYGDAALGYVSRRGAPASIDLSWRFGVARFSEKPHTFALAEVGRQTADASRDRLAATGLRRLLLVSDKPDRKLSLGRGIYRTGVGIRGTYNIDSLAGPVDHIRYRGKIGFWGTEGVLDVAWWTDMNQGQRNYVLTKRLEMSLSPELEFSISDTARTRAVTSPFYLISPLSLWTSLLRDRVFGDTTVFEDDNVMNHAELYWVASDALHLYADAAIDEVDLALVLDTVGVYRLVQSLLGWTGAFQSEPGQGASENGILLGLYAPDLDGKRRLAGRLEAAWASPRLGITSRDPALDYFRDGVPLQHRLGPDARGLYGELRYLPPSDWLASAYVELAERGLSLPSTSREAIWGLSVSRQLGRNAALRLNLTHRERWGAADARSSRQSSTAASVSVHAWF